MIILLTVVNIAFNISNNKIIPMIIKVLVFFKESNYCVLDVFKIIILLLVFRESFFEYLSLPLSSSFSLSSE